MASRGRPAIYSSGAERQAAYRERRRQEAQEALRCEHERQAAAARKAAYIRQEENRLVTMAYELCRRLHPEYARRGDLPNGYSAMTEAIDLLEIALEAPDLVDALVSRVHERRAG